MSRDDISIWVGDVIVHVVEAAVLNWNGARNGFFLFLPVERIEVDILLPTEAAAVGVDVLDENDSLDATNPNKTTDFVKSLLPLPLPLIIFLPS